MNYTFDYSIFMKEFSSLQQKMLFLDTGDTRHGFNILYRGAIAFFSKIYERNKKIKKDQKNYIIKKQSELILKYLYELDKANQELQKISAVEIIKLFEKQYKFKKILNTFMEYNKKN